MEKKSLLVLFAIALTLKVFPQLTLDQMININIGETFVESKPKIKSLFTQKPQIMKADFFGAYRIEYEKLPLEYYGNAEYTFQYAKDTLVSIKVAFTFLAPDSLGFRRLYNTLTEDLNNDKSKLLLEKYSNLNTKEIFKYINEHCKLTAPRNDQNYAPIKTKFLGENFWAIVNNSSNKGKFLRLYVHLSEIHSRKSENGSTYTFDGGGAIITLELTSEKFQTLKNREENMETLNYKSVIEE